MFWDSGVSCVQGGMAAHKVFCPQKWSLDGQNHRPGSLWVSLDASLILGLAVQTLPLLVGAGAAAPGQGWPSKQCPKPPCTMFQETLSWGGGRGTGGLWHLANLLGGGGWEDEEGWFREGSGFGFCLSGSPSFHLLLSQRCPREEVRHHHPVRRGAQQLSGEWQRDCRAGLVGLGWVVWRGGWPPCGPGTLWSWEGTARQGSSVVPLPEFPNTELEGERLSLLSSRRPSAAEPWPLAPAGLLHSPSWHHSLS